MKGSLAEVRAGEIVYIFVCVCVCVYESDWIRFQGIIRIQEHQGNSNLERLTGVNMAYILSVGECLWDSLPSGLYLGGAPLNVAVHVAEQVLSTEL